MKILFIPPPDIGNDLKERRIEDAIGKLFKGEVKSTIWLQHDQLFELVCEADIVVFGVLGRGVTRTAMTCIRIAEALHKPIYEFTEEKIVKKGDDDERKK